MPAPGGQYTRSDGRPCYDPTRARLDAENFALSQLQHGMQQRLARSIDAFAQCGETKRCAASEHRKDLLTQSVQPSLKVEVLVALKACRASACSGSNREHTRIEKL
jgi:hypothetical protein